MELLRAVVHSEGVTALVCAPTRPSFGPPTASSRSSTARSAARRTAGSGCTRARWLVVRQPPAEQLHDLLAGLRDQAGRARRPAAAGGWRPARGPARRAAAGRRRAGSRPLRRVLLQADEREQQRHAVLALAGNACGAEPAAGGRRSRRRWERRDEARSSAAADGPAVSRLAAQSHVVVQTATTSRPSMRTRPLVRQVRPPMRLSSVVFPDPDRPRTATSSGPARRSGSACSEGPCTHRALPYVREGVVDEQQRLGIVVGPPRSSRPVADGALLLSGQPDHGLRAAAEPDALAQAAQRGRGESAPAPNWGGKPTNAVQHGVLLGVGARRRRSRSGAAERLGRLVRPSRMLMVRCTWLWRRRGSWVTIRTVTPELGLTSRSAANTWRGRTRARRWARRRRAPRARWRGDGDAPPAAVDRRTSAAGSRSRTVRYLEQARSSSTPGGCAGVAVTGPRPGPSAGDVLGAR